MTHQVVFLDFDGVLNTWNHRSNVAADLFNRYGLNLLNLHTQLKEEDSALLLMNELVQRVNRLVEGAVVVASTEWRKRQTPAQLTTILRLAGGTFDVRSATPVIGDRTLEIQSWLHRYRERTGQRCQYVAIDDTPLPDLRSVRISSNTGITNSDVDLALTLLRAPP